MNSRIIVVEDELFIARDIKEILEEEGFEVTVNVTSVEQATELIEALNPILVLVDINLNRSKDGVDLGHYLLNKDRIPFIYITSFTDKLTMDRVKETRPYGFIVKPFKTIDILTNVALVLNNYQYKSIDVLRMEEPANDEVPYRIKETINFINQNIHERIEINDLIKITKWKTHHFIRTFTQTIGVTPYQYILNRKVERAKILMDDEQYTITDIGYMLGFQSYTNFAKAFKRATEYSPKEFKKLMKANKAAKEQTLK